MGAFDDVLGMVSCPACSARYARSLQTKLFEPDYHDRPGGTFEIGGPPVRVHLSVEHFEERAGREGWDDDWIALAPWQRGTPLVVIAEDEAFYCSCAAFVVPELRFDLCADGDHTDVRLVAIESELLSRSSGFISPSWLLWFASGRGSVTLIEMEALVHVDDETLSRVSFVHFEHQSSLVRGAS